MTQSQMVSQALEDTKKGGLARNCTRKLWEERKYGQLINLHKMKTMLEVHNVSKKYHHM